MQPDQITKNKKIFSKDDFEIIKKQFQKLDGVIYLNTALASILPVCVENSYLEEQQIFQESFADESNWENQRQKAKERIGLLIGSGPENIALLSNTVEGISMMARDYSWDQSKDIVTYAGEHPSNLLPWILGERRGNFRLKMIEVQKECLTTEDVLETLDENTQALAISAVQFSDGARIDLERVGLECRRMGIIFIVDGIQAIGRLHVDVEKAGIDFLACGAHKGLLVRNGIAFVYCSEKILQRLMPSTASTHSITGFLHKCASDLEEPIPWHSDARRLENGNRNHQGVCGLITSLDLLNRLEIKAIEDQILTLQRYLYEQLGKDAEKIKPFGELLSGIIRVDFPPLKEDKVSSCLRENKIFATVRGDNVRFCISFFNTLDQMKTLAAVIRFILNLEEEHT